MVIFVLTFPDGSLLSPRWRAVAWPALLSGVASALTAALLPGPITDFPLIQNRFSIGEPSQYDVLTLLAR